MANAAVLLVAGLWYGCTPAADSRVCSTDAECAGYLDTPQCDRSLRLCAGPCVGDQRRDYVCADGVREYCADDRNLPCDVCPSSCGAGSYCEADGSCAAIKAVGERCSNDVECEHYCFEGRCGVPQGAECTNATCDGFCTPGDGRTFCVRECRGGCPGGADDAGYMWACIRFGWETTAPAYCVPIDDCRFEGSPCDPFDNGVCGMACPETGCFNFCVPRPIEDLP